MSKPESEADDAVKLSGDAVNLLTSELEACEEIAALTVKNGVTVYAPVDNDSELVAYDNATHTVNPMVQLPAGMVVRVTVEYLEGMDACAFRALMDRKFEVVRKRRAENERQRILHQFALTTEVEGG